MVEVAPLAASGPSVPTAYNDFDVEANQLSGEFGKPLKPILCIAPLYRDVLPLDPSQLPQCIGESCVDTRESWHAGIKIADYVYFRGLLRTRCERPCHG
jgi:hypothetical protein